MFQGNMGDKEMKELNKENRELEMVKQKETRDVENSGRKETFSKPEKLRTWENGGFGKRD